MTITFTVPGCPVGQPRHRHGHKIFGRRSRLYIPKDHPVHAFKSNIQLMARKAYKGDPIKGPISLTVIFVFPRPKKMIWKKKEMTRYPHVSTPDIDNCFKAATDCLNKILWDDDRQVVSVNMRKVVASGDEEAHVDFLVSEMDAES